MFANFTLKFGWIVRNAISRIYRKISFNTSLTLNFHKEQHLNIFLLLVFSSRFLVEVLIELTFEFQSHFNHFISFYNQYSQNIVGYWCASCAEHAKGSPQSLRRRSDESWRFYLLTVNLGMQNEKSKENEKVRAVRDFCWNNVNIGNAWQGGAKTWNCSIDKTNQIA